MTTEDESKPPVGAGHLNAMARLGLAELRNAIYPESNVAQRHAEYGVFGTATPQEVMQDKLRESTREMAAEAWIEERIGRSVEQPEPTKDDREPERDQ